MPISGLPVSLEAVLGSLLQQNSISSWKVTGTGAENTVVVLRLTSQTHADIEPPTTLRYRKKPPSQLKRDRERLQQRITLQTEKEMTTKNQASDCNYDASPVLFCSPPNQQTVHTTQADSDTDIDTLTVKPVVIPRATRPASPQPTDSETVGAAARCETGSCSDNERITADSVTDNSDGESEMCCDVGIPEKQLHTAERAAVEEGFSLVEIKERVGSIMNRSLQERLRNKQRNVNFRKFVADTKNDERLICESDEVVIVNRKPTGGGCDDVYIEHWFVKQNYRNLLPDENAFMTTLIDQTTSDRSTPQCLQQRSAARRQLASLMGAMQFYLG